MTSYIPIKIDDNVFPIKVGGYNGKSETKMIATPFQLKHATPEFKAKVLDVSARDVRSAYMMWIPKTMKDQFKDREFVTAVLPNNETQRIGIKECKRWSRGSMACWFTGQPFKALSLTTVKDMVRDGSGLVGINFDS